MSEKITPQVFTSKEFGSIRAIVKDGSPLFCGIDITKALGYVRPNNVLDTHCKGMPIYYVLQTHGGLQTVRFITEGDVYRFVTSSKLKSAQRFGLWIFDEVLPAIRHDDRRMVVKDETMEQVMARAVLLAQCQGTLNAIFAYLIGWN